MLGLRTTIYKVDDLQEAVNWYSKVFEATPYFEAPTYVGFNIKGYELGLMPETYSSDKVDAILSYWGVDNIETAYQRLLSLGGIVYEAPVNVGGNIMMASVLDPWRNVLGIIYNPEFKLPS
jgi:lactoylglutathione lyase